MSRGALPADGDARFMAAAIRLGRRELGRSWPNPAVGTLIVAPDGMIVGRGWTQPRGRPHSETVALAEAGERARGATAYVSLEPCSHHGKSPPCVDGLVAAGIGRVVFALEDPNPEVAGKGHARLRAAGLEVVSGILAESARAAHAGHIMRITKGRPWVTLKLAISRDGCIAGPQRAPLAITGAEARAQGHMLRATNDAILVGIGTVLADDPELTCRLPGMEDRSPVRVVMDSRLRLPVKSRLLETAERWPVWVVTGASAAAPQARQLSAAGASIIDVAMDSAGRVDMSAALAVLAERGITRLLVEGGAEIAGSLVADDLVDEAVIFQSQLQIGAGGVEAIAAVGLAALTESEAYRRVDTRPVGADRMTIYSRVR